MNLRIRITPPTVFVSYNTYCWWTQVCYFHNTYFRFAHTDIPWNQLNPLRPIFMAWIANNFYQFYVIPNARISERLWPRIVTIFSNSSYMNTLRCKTQKDSKSLMFEIQWVQMMHILFFPIYIKQTLMSQRGILRLIIKTADRGSNIDFNLMHFFTSSLFIN